MTSLKNLALAGLCLVFTTQWTFAQRVDPLRSKTLDEAMAGREYQAIRRVEGYQAQAPCLMGSSFAAPTAPQLYPQVDAQGRTIGVQRDVSISPAMLARIRAEHAGNPQVQRQVARVEWHYARARNACGLTEEQCLQERGNNLTISSCCSQLWYDMNAAEHEARKLFEMINVERPVSLRRPVTKRPSTK